MLRGEIDPVAICVLVGWVVLGAGHALTNPCTKTPSADRTRPLLPQVSGGSWKIDRR